MVCSVSDKWRMPDSEKQANARLISLAPEMAELLRQANQIIGKVVADNLMPGIVMPNFPKAVMTCINDVLARLDGKGEG